MICIGIHIHMCRNVSIYIYIMQKHKENLQCRHLLSSSNATAPRTKSVQASCQRRPLEMAKIFPQRLAKIQSAQQRQHRLNENPSQREVFRQEHHMAHGPCPNSHTHPLPLQYPKRSEQCHVREANPRAEWMFWIRP